MTKSRNAIFAILLLSAPFVRAQELPELLQAVNEAKARQLIQYNSPWLQAELYFAKRSRIVTVNASLLLTDDDFTVTPFDDIAPLHVTKGNVQRYEEAFSWVGWIIADLPEAVRAAGVRQAINLYGLAWDTDEFGRASESSENRFQFSPQWTFDFFDRPILGLREGQGLATGPPPQTPAEIARHKALLKLNKSAFYSVSADFQLLLPNARYRLAPLKYTPKYSVIFELDPAKLVPITLDRPPSGEPITRTPDDRVKISEYENFIRNLPPDRNVAVVEELP